MLAKQCYDHEDVAAIRGRLEGHLDAWGRLATSEVPELEAFEPVFFNRLVIELHASFVQHPPSPAGPPADARTEVRVLACSLLGDGRLCVGRDVRWCAERTVLGYRPGDEIAVREAGFRALTASYLAELETLVG